MARENLMRGRGNVSRCLCVEISGCVVNCSVSSHGFKFRR